MKISQIVLLTVMVIGCAQASRRALKHENPQVKKHQVHHTEHRLKKFLKKKDDCGDYETEFTDIKGQLATLKTEMEAQKTACASSKLEMEAQKATQASQQLEIDALKKSGAEKPKELTPFEKVVIQDKTINLLQQATVVNQYSEDDKELAQANANLDPSLCLQSFKDHDNRQVFYKDTKTWEASIGHGFAAGTKDNKLKAVIDIGSVVSLGAFSVFQYKSHLNNIIFYKAKDEAATSPPGPGLDNWVLVKETPIQVDQAVVGPWNAQKQFTTVPANVIAVPPFKAKYLMVVGTGGGTYQWTIISGLKGFSS